MTVNSNRLRAASRRPNIDDLIIAYDRYERSMRAEADIQAERIRDLREASKEVRS